MFGAVPLLGSFWINVVFPLVIQSGTCACCRHLFISRASLSWTEENFLNQNPCIPSCPGVFQFDIFFSVCLRNSIFISALEPSSSLSSSHIINPFSLYVMLFRLPYFRPKSFGFTGVWLLVWFCVMTSQLLIKFSFVVLECPVLFVLFYPLWISLQSSFFRKNLLVYLLKLYCYFFSCLLFHSLPTYYRIFLFYHFGLFS